MSSCATDEDGFNDGEVVVPTGACCTCSCSDAGEICATVTVKGDENDSCDQLCAQTCLAQFECPTLETYATCSAQEGKGDDPCTKTCGILDSCEAVSYADEGGCDCIPPEQQQVNVECFENAECNPQALNDCLDAVGENFRNVRIAL